MIYVAGIDGGGTRTRCAIVDAYGNLAGVGYGGPSNYDDVGAEVAGANIAHALNDALCSLPSRTQPAAIFFGMAGVVSAEDRATIVTIARRIECLAHLPHEQIGVDHDIKIALAGATCGQPGIVLIAGTGSSCYGENAAGESWRAGGWGFLVDDLGSSYYLGQQAIVVATQAYDGRGPATLLLDRIQQRLGLTDMNAIMRWMYVPAVNRSAIAALSPLVTAAADEGDAVAAAIIERGCTALAEMVAAVATRLGMAASPTPVIAVGGLAQSGPLYAEPLKRAIQARYPHALIQSPTMSPVAGAGLLALRLAGIAPETALLNNLRAGAARIAAL